MNKNDRNHVTDMIPYCLSLWLVLVVVSLVSTRTDAFVTTRQVGSVQSRSTVSPSSASTTACSTNGSRISRSVVISRDTTEIASTSSPADEDDSNFPTTTSSDKLNQSIERLCGDGKIDAALTLLQRAEEETPQLPDERSYILIILSLAAASSTEGNMEDNYNNKNFDERLKKLLIAETLLKRMKHRSSKDGYTQCQPRAQTYSALVFIWSKLQSKSPTSSSSGILNSNSTTSAAAGTSLSSTPSFEDDSELTTMITTTATEERCLDLLNELWSLYETTKDNKYVPTKSTYIATLSALSRCVGGTRAAQQAEDLLEDMEQQSQQNNHIHLEPTTICFNIVL